MKLFSFLQNKDDQDDELLLEEDSAVESNEEAYELDSEEDEGITLGTKIKVIAALLVVSFASYVAYWVQEPSYVKVDILDSRGSIAEEELVAAVDGTHEIAIIDFAFDTTDLEVEGGATIIWTNMDSVEHTVTGDTFTSGPLSSGESYTYTFDDEGTYDYFCSFHPQMKGTITVTSSVADLTHAAGDSLGEITSLDPFMEDTLTTEDPPETITLDAQDFLAASILEEATITEQTLNTTESGQLAQTGPEDFLYGILLLVILYFNRRKLLGTHGTK